MDIKMKTFFYILGCGLLTIWFGFTDFTNIPKVKTFNSVEWQPSNDGIIEINHAKIDVSKADQQKKIEIQNAKQYIEQLKIIENDSLIRLSHNDN